MGESEGTAVPSEEISTRRGASECIIYTIRGVYSNRTLNRNSFSNVTAILKRDSTILW